MRVRVTRRGLQQAKTTVNAAYRLAKLVPKAQKVMTALQSGQVNDWEAWDELELALDAFILKYLP